MYRRRTMSRPFAAAALALALLSGAAACGSEDQANAETGSGTAGTVNIAAQAKGIGKPAELKVGKQQTIADEVPAAVKADGRLTIGIGALPTGFPPLAF